MKNVLIVGDNIKEINKLRRVFGFDFKVSATNSPENAVSVLRDKPADLAVYHAGAGIDLNMLFNFYKNLRRNPSTETVPLMVIACAAVLRVLSDVVEMNNAAVIGDDVGEEEMMRVIGSMLG